MWHLPPPLADEKRTALQYLCYSPSMSVIGVAAWCYPFSRNHMIRVSPRVDVTITQRTMETASCASNRAPSSDATGFVSPFFVTTMIPLLLPRTSSFKQSGLSHFRQTQQALAKSCEFSRHSRTPLFPPFTATASIIL